LKIQGIKLKMYKGMFKRLLTSVYRITSALIGHTRRLIKEMIFKINETEPSTKTGTKT